ncbi:MAG: host attachment protein [Nitrospiraceae bacterium]|nr:host attachment protein [Nitrospiraceae bacterium]
MDRIIIAVDLGRFRAYRVTQEILESPHLKMIESYDSIEGRTKLIDKVTDTAGRFSRKASGTKVAGYPEQHNLALEEDKKIIKKIADDIEVLLSKNNSTEWYFAAPTEINGRIIERLSSEAKARLAKNVPANITKAKKADILSYFAAA